MHKHQWKLWRLWRWRKVWKLWRGQLAKRIHQKNNQCLWRTGLRCSKGQKTLTCQSGLTHLPRIKEKLYGSASIMQEPIAKMRLWGKHGRKEQRVKEATLWSNSCSRPFCRVGALWRGTNTSKRRLWASRSPKAPKNLMNGFHFTPFCKDLVLQNACAEWRRKAFWLEEIQGMVMNGNFALSGRWDSRLKKTPMKSREPTMAKWMWKTGWSSRARA